MIKTRHLSVNQKGVCSFTAAIVVFHQSLLCDDTCSARRSLVLRNIAWAAWSLGPEAGCDRAFWCSLSCAVRRQTQKRTVLKKVCSLCPRISVYRIPPLPATHPILLLMQARQSWKCRIMFDKHSSQEASYSDFTTSGTWRIMGPFQTQTPRLGFSAHFLLWHVGQIVKGLECYILVCMYVCVCV